MTNTKNIVKLAHIIHYISTLKKDNFQTDVNFDNKVLQNTQTSFVPLAILFNVALCYTPSGFLGLLVCWKTGIRWLAIGLKP